MEKLAGLSDITHQSVRCQAVRLPERSCLGLDFDSRAHFKGGTVVQVSGDGCAG